MQEDFFACSFDKHSGAKMLLQSTDLKATSENIKIERKSNSMKRATIANKSSTKLTQYLEKRLPVKIPPLKTMEMKQLLREYDHGAHHSLKTPEGVHEKDLYVDVPSDLTTGITKSFLQQKDKLY